MREISPAVTGKIVANSDCRGQLLWPIIMGAELVRLILKVVSLVAVFRYIIFALKITMYRLQLKDILLDCNQMLTVAR